jgi:bifunctional ADP-heptose synthase (sugar kinase/adenylyltransferase)
MAANAATVARVDVALSMLQAGHSASATVSHLAGKHGISRRQGQRIVAKAYQVLRDDIEQSGINRREESAQLVHTLHAAMAKALASGHASAVVGCSRELRELLGLGA